MCNFNKREKRITTRWLILEGKNHCFADPKRVFETIKKSGYKECVACQKRVEGEW